MNFFYVRAAVVVATQKYVLRAFIAYTLVDYLLSIGESHADGEKRRERVFYCVDQ